MKYEGDRFVSASKTGRRGSGRFRLMDRQRVNLDGVAVEDDGRGLVAFDSRHDPAPELEVRNGSVTRMDGKSVAEFDVIDHFIASHGIDVDAAPDVMAMESSMLARLVVDPTVSRREVMKLASGMTPAKLASVVSLLHPVEMQMGIMKMRARRTPSNQAHVTNRLDDPLLIAADAATAVALGFRELETTVAVLGDAAAAAVGLLIGSQVGKAGALTQCSVEEAMELDLGMRGLVSYAETVSLYGTQSVFVDGDDSPWSKGFLVSAYASRGMKMRVSSGAGAEVLMGNAEGKSMCYLEARCVSLAHAAGAQGVQNGGIDGASVAASVPGGLREMLGENLMVMMKGMESCSGNDALMSESDMRRTSRSFPLFLAGSDFITSGFGSIPRYDNMFGPSNFNAEDIDDFLLMQRDWGVDGGLETADEEAVITLRREAARATRDVFRELGLADFSEGHVEAAVFAEGSKDVDDFLDDIAVGRASALMDDMKINVIDVLEALRAHGHDGIADRIGAMLRTRMTGDHLQTSAIFDAELKVLSAITDPNDYSGPGTGYRPSGERLQVINSVRQARSIDDLLESQAAARPRREVRLLGPALVSQDPRDVVIGVSPAFGDALRVTLSGLSVFEVLEELSAGMEEEGCLARVVRFYNSIDLGAIGLQAARLAGSGVSVGLLSKGTALIHRRDLQPLANLELFSMAPLVTRDMYRSLGANAARHAKGGSPGPIRNAYTEEAIEARYHAKVVSMVGVEKAALDASREAEVIGL